MSYITSRHDIRISHPAVKAVSVALECFVQSFAQEAFRHAQRKRSSRNSIKYADISYVANHFSTLHFLQDFLPEPQSAAFVVKKVLDNAGVNTDRSFAEDAELDQETTKGTKKPTTEKKAKNIVQFAQRLAKKWDREPAYKDWRTVSPHILRKRHKKNWIYVSFLFRTKPYGVRVPENDGFLTLVQYCKKYFMELPRPRNLVWMRPRK